jgi:hypothetical protein
MAAAAAESWALADSRAKNRVSDVYVLAKVTAAAIAVVYLLSTKCRLAS